MTIIVSHLAFITISLKVTNILYLLILFKFAGLEALPQARLEGVVQTSSRSRFAARGAEGSQPPHRAHRVVGGAPGQVEVSRQERRARDNGRGCRQHWWKRRRWRRQRRIRV